LSAYTRIVSESNFNELTGPFQKKWNDLKRF